MGVFVPFFWSLPAQKSLRRRRVRYREPWKIVGCNACVSKEYAAVLPGSSPPVKPHPREKAEFLEEKWRQESLGRLFRTAAHHVCACARGRPNPCNLGILVLSERNNLKATAKLQSKMHESDFVSKKKKKKKKDVKSHQKVRNVMSAPYDDGALCKISLNPCRETSLLCH